MIIFFFFKQKTAYEMRISDWSSDVCSSDLIEVPNRKAADVRLHGILTSKQWEASHEPLAFAIGKDISGEAVVGELNRMPHVLKIGRASCRERVCQYV